MKINFSIILFFVLGFIKAQTTDSLLYQLNSILNDTESVNQMYQQGFSLRNADPDRALMFAQNCYQKAIKSNSIKHLAKSYNLLGILNYKKNNYNKALQYQKKALQLNKSINNSAGCAINLSNLGNIYSDINYLELAETNYLQALQINNGLQNTKEMSRCLINIATLKHTQKQHTAAIYDLKQALIYANDLGDYELIATCNNNIGIALAEQNNLDTALLYLQDGLKMRILIDDEVDLANSYTNIARIYVKQKKYNEAQNLISLAQSTCSNFKIFDELVSLYLVQSEFYESQNNYQLATSYLKKHYQLKDSLFALVPATTNTEMVNDTFEENNTSSKYSLKLIMFISLASLLLGSLITYLIYRKK